MAPCGVTHECGVRGQAGVADVGLDRRPGYSLAGKDRIPLGNGGFDDELTAPGHSIAPVDDEIDDDLFQRVRIGIHAGSSGAARPVLTSYLGIAGKEVKAPDGLKRRPRPEMSGPLVVNSTTPRRLTSNGKRSMRRNDVWPREASWIRSVPMT